MIAIVVTHNRVEKLKYTVQCYLESPVRKVLIVDNASTDATAAYLKELRDSEPDRVEVLRLPENIGGAGGYFCGLDYAKKNFNCDWLVLSDDDSYPGSGVISDFLSDEKVNLNRKQLVAAKVLFPDGEACPMNRPMSNPSFWLAVRNFFSGRGFLALSDCSFESDIPLPVMASSFVGMFIPFQVLRSSGVMPCRDYFLYWDDISFCLDMKKAGVGTVFYPKLTFYHDCPRRSGKISGSRFYYFIRNGFRTIKKMPVSIRYPALLIKGFVWFLQAIRSNAVKIYLRALRDV